MLDPQFLVVLFNLKKWAFSLKVSILHDDFVHFVHSFIKFTTYHQIVYIIEMINPWLKKPNKLLSLITVKDNRRGHRPVRKKSVIAGVRSSRFSKKHKAGIYHFHDLRYILISSLFWYNSLFYLCIKGP